MPIHDWTRVTAGIWHDFHGVWISELRTALNDGLLPSEYYALSEQIAGPRGPEVLTPQSSEQTYNAAYRGVPNRWKRVLEPTEQK
jgi:hypothetical protein